MADRAFINIPADTWTLAASNVTAGQIHIIEPTNNDWYYTVRDTGNPKPTTEEPEVKIWFQSARIQSSISIDVYVYCKNNAGEIAVDL